MASIDALTGLALTQHFMGLGDEAAETVDRLDEFVQEFRTILNSCQTPAPAGLGLTCCKEG